MTSQWKRWSPLSGIAFVVLGIVGLFTGATAGTDKSNEEFVAYFAEGTGAHVAGFFIFAVACLFFLVFLNSLRARMAEAEGSNGSMAGLAFAGGITSIILLLLAATSFGSTSAAVEFDDQFVVDPNLVRMLDSLGMGFFIASGMTAAVVVAAASVVALKTDFLPRWLGWVGIVVAIALLATFAWVPWWSFLLWIVVVSVVMVVRRPKTAKADEATPLASDELLAATE